MIVHTYYQLLVNANDVILTGVLAPQEEFLRVGRNRESYRISRVSVSIAYNWVLHIVGSLDALPYELTYLDGGRGVIMWVGLSCRGYRGKTGDYNHFNSLQIPVW